MAKLENKKTNPVLAAIANLCCCEILGYILIGQTQKGIFVMICCIALLPLFGLGLLLGVLAAVDVYKVAEAVSKGEEIDEHEYKMEILYKIVKIIHKDAVFKS